jgi:cell division protein FtsB
MTDDFSNPLDQEQAPPPSGGSGLMFWILVGMAAVVFAPCVLLPVWRDYQALQYAEQVEQAGLEQARAELHQQQRRLEALQSDPAAIARVARREFRYRDPQEIAVPVSVRPEGPLEAAPVVLTPVQPPAAVAWLTERLPETDYDRLFCAAPTRTILMGLAGGLVCSAFLLYWPRRVDRCAKPG